MTQKAERSAASRDARVTSAGLSRAPASAMALSLLYAAGPLIIMVELLKPVLWVPVLILVPLWIRALDSFFFPAAGRSNPPAVRPALGIAIGAGTFALGFAWLYYSGVGSFGLCRYDYIKHNFIFSNLMNSNLPIFFQYKSAPDMILHYYFSYYILPVRIFDGITLFFHRIDVDAVILALYALILFLSLRTIAACFRVSPLLLLALFALAGGLDVAGVPLLGGELIENGRVPIFDLPIYVGVEWWGVPYAPQSITANLYWAPQHFFAALIGLALLGCIFRLDRPASARLAHAFWVVTASAFWSPYVAVGLGALVLGAIVFPKRLLASPAAAMAAAHGSAAGPVVAAGAFSLALFAFMVVFFMAAAPVSLPRLAFNAASFPSWLITYLLRHATAIVTLAVLCMRRPGADGVHGRARDAGDLAWTIALCLLLNAILLCLAHGRHNDWAMRATLPVSMLLAVTIARALSSSMRVYFKGIILSVFAASSMASLAEIAQSTVLPPQCPAYGQFDLGDLGVLRRQYEGLPDSLLYRYLVRQR